VLGPASVQAITLLSIIGISSAKGISQECSETRSRELPRQLMPASGDAKICGGEFIVTIDPDDARDFDEQFTWRNRKRLALGCMYTIETSPICGAKQSFGREARPGAEGNSVI